MVKAAFSCWMGQDLLRVTSYETTFARQASASKHDRNTQCHSSTPIPALSSWDQAFLRANCGDVAMTDRGFVRVPFFPLCSLTAAHCPGSPGNNHSPEAPRAPGVFCHHSQTQGGILGCLCKARS